MEKALTYLGEVLAIVPYYPWWTRMIFWLALGSTLVAVFCAITFYSTAQGDKTSDKLLAGLSDEGKKHLQTLQKSDEPEELNRAVAYFKRFPNERALEALRGVASRDESKFVFVRVDAIGAIGEIGSKLAVETLLKEARTERSPGVIEKYLSALYPFVEKYPDLITPFIGDIIETAGGDVVGYPATRIARKLGDPKFVPQLFKLCETNLDRTYPEYSQYCRDTIRELDLKGFHKERGIEVNLPQSMDLIMTQVTQQTIMNERRPIRLDLYLWYQADRRSLPEDQVKAIAIKFLAHPDPMIRWSALGLIDNVPAGEYEELIRKSFQVETRAFLENIILEKIERQWQPKDCDLLVTKLRRFSVRSKEGMYDFRSKAAHLISAAARQNCRAVTPILRNISLSLAGSSFNKDEKDMVDNAIRVLENN